MKNNPKLWIRPADSVHLNDILSIWESNPRNRQIPVSLLKSAFWSSSYQHSFLVACDGEGNMHGWVALLPIIPPTGASGLEVRLELCMAPGKEDIALEARLLKAACAYSLSTDLRNIFCADGVISANIKETALNLGWQKMGDFPFVLSEAEGGDLWAFSVPKISDGRIEFGNQTLFTARK